MGGVKIKCVCVYVSEAAVAAVPKDGAGRGERKRKACTMVTVFVVGDALLITNLLSVFAFL